VSQGKCTIRIHAILAGLAGKKFWKSVLAVVGAKCLKRKFDTDKKILHNLISVLKTITNRATGSEFKASSTEYLAL
jgi:hypothetical protein